MMKFQYAIFDDNYLPYGDSFGLKQASDADGNLHRLLGREPVALDNFGKTKLEMSFRDLEVTSNQMHAWVDVYYEFPPLWNFSAWNRFRLPGFIIDTVTRPPLLQTHEPFTEQNMKEHRTAYTWMCFVKLHPLLPHE